MSTEFHPKFTISEERSTDCWIAREEETGMVSQGIDPHDAIDNLQEALELRDEGAKMVNRDKGTMKRISDQFGDDYFGQNPNWADDLEDLGEDF